MGNETNPNEQNPNSNPPTVDVDKLKSDLLAAQKSLTKVTEENTKLASANKGFADQVTEAGKKASEYDKLVAKHSETETVLKGLQSELEAERTNHAQTRATALEGRRTYLVQRFGLDAEKVKGFTAEQLDALDSTLPSVKVSIESKGLDLSGNGGGGANSTDLSPHEKMKAAIAKAKGK